MTNEANIELNKIYLGDCLDVLKTLPDNSVDSIVTEISKRYIITKDGKCINRKRNREVVFPLDHKGYYKTRLHCPLLSKNKDGRISFRIHRLVAMFFLKDFDPKLQVNHKNGIKTDNRVENLEMVTNAQNAWHGRNVLDSKQRRLNLSLRNMKHGNK